MNTSFKCRFDLGHTPTTAEGWSVSRITQPSRLYGANGLRTGADGRIYIAQVAGSQISAINIDNGEVEVISPMGGEIVAPDDLAFDSMGNLFATEITEGRVSVIERSGTTRVLMGDMPCANPITVYKDRIFAGECRPGGRIMELFLSGAAPRILLDNVPMPNAMEVGPDGKLYFPVMGVNEIWRVDLDGGAPEVVAKDLGVPDSVKFDSDGSIISTQVASGQVLRINPSNGEKTILADIAPGLDNSTFINGRLFVSSITGSIHEILGQGQFKPLVEEGLQWPLGLAIDKNGVLFVADGGFTYTLTGEGKLNLAGMLFSPGFPGYSRGVASVSPGQWIVTTANGEVVHFWPEKYETKVLASGYDRLMDIALTSKGIAITVEFGSGKALAVNDSGASEIASGLDKPMGVAVDADDNCYVSESGAGRVVKIIGSKVDTVVDGLKQPQGIAVHQGKLYVVDIDDKSLTEVELATGKVTTIANYLPIGAPPGVIPKPLKAIGTLAGPMLPFCGITISSSGTIYVSGDAEGSVLKIQHG